MTTAEPTVPINVAETLAEIRRRVAARLARTVPEIPELAVPPLEHLRQARSVAEAWTYSLGQVNPRPAGLVNAVAQFFKKLLARSLRWFAFPQTQFNAGAVATLIRAEDMFADINRNLVVLGQNLADRQRAEAALAQRISEQEAALAQRISEAQQGTQLVLGVFRQEMDHLAERLTRTGAHVDAVSRDAGAAVDAVSQALTRVQAELGHDINQVQEQYWKDFGHYRDEHQALHTRLDEEVRELRQRVRAATVAPTGATVPSAATLPEFDYPRFEEKFRGKEEEIRRRQEFYLPILKDAAPVLDVACGRGEMLGLLREQGIAARGVDLDADMVQHCLDQKLPVERADALAYLEAQPDKSLGAVFSAQFVEHLPVAAYSRLVALAYRKLRKGGRLILETQNPECLAIYSQTFYLDPTHVRPVPAAQLHFLLEEAGFQQIETHYLAPTGETLPQLPLWPGDGPAKSWNEAAGRFNRTYFGFMDYAIVGQKP
jgi:O-antigen chain-terminating methyltransferase